MPLRVLVATNAAGLDAARAAEPDGIVLDADALKLSGIRKGLQPHPPLGGKPDDSTIALLVRISPLSAANTEHELDLVLRAGGGAVVLAGTRGRADVERLGIKLAVREAELGLPDGETRIVATIDDAAGALAVPSLAAAPLPRLAAILLDADRLAADLSCTPDAPPIAWAKAQCVLAAAASGCPALLGLGPHDSAEAVARARREGFRGALLADPALVPAARKSFG